MNPNSMTTPAGYDIIGDVHGEARKLERLLEDMDYVRQDGTWSHPDRMAVFVGDYVDRGPDQVGVYRIVRKMVEAGAAHAIMGNHELNAIAYATRDENGDWCRKHTKDNEHSHAEFLEQVGEGSALHQEIIAWLLTLPLWLENEGIRVVHACWDEQAMKDIAPYLGPDNTLPAEYIPAAAGVGSVGRCFIRHDGSVDEGLHPLYRSIETLLKGVEVALPEGISYHAEGKERFATRVGWWSPEGTSYDDGAIFSRQQRRELQKPLPDDALPLLSLKPQNDPRPLFIGHYWRRAGEEAIVAPNIVCVDFSACRGGDMVAYRWSGEPVVDPRNLIGVQKGRP